MKFLTLLLLLNFVVFYSSGKKKDLFYPSDQISPALKENANAVVRYRKAVLDINSIKNVEYIVTEVVTVLNKNGDDQAVLYVPYDSHIKPEISHANFYNGGGELIKKVKKTEIYDQCYFDGFSLYNDARFKRITPQIQSYPYTVEYEYSFSFDGIIDFPDWHPVVSYNVAVEKSEFRINVSNDSEVRFKKYKLEDKEEVNEDEKSKSYIWSISDFPAMVREPYSVAFSELVPKLIVSPVEFSYYGSEGKMDSWENFGRWSNSLLIGRDDLSDNRKQFVKNLISGESDIYNKVKKVYEYLQQNTRYVSVQLGIGGFQPFSASTVDEVGYGDCKALTNYMKTMLSVVDIESFYTLVKAGRNVSEIDPGFSSQEFNHVILTVPIDNDTLFLECTNQYYPCGFIGDFTNDRYALMVTDNGGELIRTKSYKEDVNTWRSKAFVKIEEKGDAVVKDSVTFCGLQYNYVEDELRKTRDKQIESEFKNSDLPGVHFLDVNYSEKRHSIPEAKRIRVYEVDKLATPMGSRMFLPLNILNKRTAVPKTRKERKYPFKINMAFNDRDTVVYSVPEGYEPEYLIEPKSISSVFGEFSCSVDFKNGSIIYIRSEKRKAGTFPAEKYAEYVSFSKEIVKADSQKLVLKKL